MIIPALLITLGLLLGLIDLAHQRHGGFRRVLAAGIRAERTQGRGPGMAQAVRATLVRRVPQRIRLPAEAGHPAAAVRP